MLNFSVDIRKQRTIALHTKKYESALFQMALKDIIQEIRKLSTADQYGLKEFLDQIRPRNDDTTVSKMIVENCLFSKEATYDKLKLSEFTKQQSFSIPLKAV
ncbi:hypothetical protein [Bacillus pseudomycoides]|uniref:hypothetical protein n=1 Tax=Bacillus pseudomycoides TaxID=64104 RepID=UPI003CED74E4